MVERIGKYRILNLFNIITIILVIILNYLTYLQENRSETYFYVYVVYILFFLLIAGFGCIFNSKIATTILYLIAGLSAIVINGKDDTLGMTFLIFTFIIMQKPLFYYIVIILTIISILLKALIQDITFNQTLNVTFIHALIFIIAYFICIRKPDAAGSRS